MRVVADSHAIVWYVQGSPRLSDAGAAAHPIDVAVADACTSIPRDLLADPWDRFIVATADALAAPLVTRDQAIQQARLVPTIW